MTVEPRSESHDIFNQSPPYEDVDLFASDRALPSLKDRRKIACGGAAHGLAPLLRLRL